MPYADLDGCRVWYELKGSGVRLDDRAVKAVNDSVTALVIANKGSASYARANYVLRAMSVPAGEHEVRFHIVSKAFNSYASLASVSSWLLLVLVLGALGISFRRPQVASFDASSSTTL